MKKRKLKVDWGEELAWRELLILRNHNGLGNPSRNRKIINGIWKKYCNEIKSSATTYKQSEEIVK